MKPAPPTQKPRSTRPNAWIRFADGWYVDHDACDKAFTRMHARDPLGDRIHLVFAVGACIGLLGPQSVAQIAIAPLLVFLFVRVVNIAPVWIHGFGQPAVLAALALAGWMGITLIWSPDVVLGLEELSQLRWIVLTAFIFPVIHKRNILIGALFVGFGLTMLGQVVDAFDGFGVHALSKYFWHEPNRISGWFQPVVGGSIFIAGLGMALPIALFDRGRLRVFGFVASLLMMTSIIATGSRGAWLAMVPLVFIVLLFAGITRRVRWRSVALLALLGAATLAGVFVFAGSNIKERGSAARQEIAAALDGHYDSDTGARIRMGQLAWQATIEHPIAGVGAGGFKDWAQARDPGNERIHDHAHSTLPQLTATTGLVGLALGGVLLATLLRNGYRASKRYKSSGFSMSPLFGIVGLMSVSMTDVVLINAQTAAMLGVLAALSPAYVPGDKHPQMD